MQNYIAQRMLNTRAAAAYCGLGESTLERLRARGNGPRFILVGRRVIYDRTDLDAWLSACRRSSSADQGSVR